MFAVVFLLLCLAYALFEYRWFKVVRLNAHDFSKRAHSVNGMRVVFLTDFQYDHKLVGFRHHAMKCLIKKVNHLKPDLVILGGDIIHKKNKYNHLVFQYLAQFDAPMISVLGNHDAYDLKLVLSEFDKLGVTVLRNEAVLFNGIQIVGYDNTCVERSNNFEFNDELYTIVVSHSPDFIVDHKIQADIMLSGHLHGGQINFFGLYSPITNSRYKQKFLHGLKSVEESKIYISSGLGGYVGFLPIRFFVRPEIVCIDF